MDPRHCSIPQNVVAAVTVHFRGLDITAVVERGPPGARLPVADRSRYTIVVLVKNGQLLIVQSEDIPSSDDWRTMSYDDAMADHRAHEARLSQRLWIVASLVDTIDFDKSRFAVLVSDAQQTRLVPQPLDDIPPLTAPLGWLPWVQESEFYACHWLEDRAHCIWNGRQVDVFIPFSIAHRWRVQQMITITHVLERLKIYITSEPLAIIVRGAEILGLVMARVEGRLLEMRDRSLAYSTFAQLHEANIIFEIRPYMDGLLIRNGKLCLTQNIFCLVQCDPSDEERDFLEAFAWEGLDKIFQELPHINESLIFDVNQHWYKPTLLNHVPSPEHQILRISFGPSFFAEKYQKYLARKKRNGHSSKSLVKLDPNGSTRYKSADSLRERTYHPYSDGTNTLSISNQSEIGHHTTADKSNWRSTLLISSQLEIGRHTSDKQNRRKASSVVVRAVTVASDHTLVDVDDDATVIGDDE
ncbi:hypothetical protein EV368DRAFT_63317 [Lentinula lateritia]|uniref:Uncharacterized protein n=1 Tax=Lentinula aff. lateritia TaxID=2804960 RepID=A0ACC1TLZ5_9AGAR|nr:hypothetical protein F5876DRAFT_69575 [Lentinula aff. lateritia]KAJ3854411.1 hypothetical protein EV368DRAFT_63317 [Lentinula lateritia]